VRKGYNTPYNDPPRKRAAPAQPNAIPSPVAASVEAVALPAAVIAARAVEARAI
jgi:hypothetical protein